MRLAVLPALLVLAGCAGTQQAPDAGYRPPAGSNEVLRGDIAAAPGHQLITADIVLPPHGEVPLHYHPGEEFLYILEGSVTLTILGEEPAALKAGDAVRIPRTDLHKAKAGPEGLRALASWVVPEGQPVRIQPMQAVP